MSVPKIKFRCVHILKIFPKFFDGIVCGEKNFEVRKEDRDFQVGDAIILMEFDPEVNGGSYSQLFAGRLIVYKLSSDCCHGIQSGYCVLGLSIIPDSVVAEELKCKCGVELLEKCLSCAIDETMNSDSVDKLWRIPV
jgi:hypothetical protein